MTARPLRSRTPDVRRAGSGGGQFRWRLTPEGAPPADTSLVMLLTCIMTDKSVLSQATLLALSDAAPKQGAAVRAVGSPFGITAPQHFSNLCYDGVVSQVVQVR